ncbi:AEC family transporter [Streptomyces sp. NEAU-Y11]|uniref:AEC family transporter n=1 Tax=Streptomyces cucumeris TaxID=2962890 RepID=UPI0020C862C1|nr:AEC family transporter [Streptomyces sp. NEAU-Y11]MCP9210697.1 AEC family transporter [Streptomyces sp. NEAU-Y11]
MGGVITGFGVIASIIVTGYVLGRRGSLGEHGREVLTRLSFDVASPALLFTTLSRADLSVVLSVPLLVTALSTCVVAGVFIAVGAVRRWSLGRTTIGALCASYVNAGNLGIPIAMYVLGDAGVVAPVLLFQQLVMTPIALTVIDLGRPGARPSVVHRLTTPFRNPIVIGSLCGVAVTAAGWRIPGPVLEPLTLLGGMAVPAVLLAFGISLPGTALPGTGEERGPVLLSVALKSFAQPVVGWAIAAGVFGLGGPALFAAVVTSALPAAQNLFTYATRYETATVLARESILLSTLLAAPVLLTVAALLG